MPKKLFLMVSAIDMASGSVSVTFIAICSFTLPGAVRGRGLRPRCKKRIGLSSDPMGGGRARKRKRRREREKKMNERIRVNILLV